MMTIIYSFKIYLFRDQLQIDKNELKRLKKFLLFVVEIYIEHWFMAPNAILAPNNDLILIQKLENYKEEPVIA